MPRGPVFLSSGARLQAISHRLGSKCTRIDAAWVNTSLAHHTSPSTQAGGLAKSKPGHYACLRIINLLLLFVLCLEVLKKIKICSLNALTL